MVVVCRKNWRTNKYLLSISALLGSAIIANPTTARLPLPTGHAKELAKERCPKTIPLAKMMKIKHNGHAEIEGHTYYPANVEEFNKNAPDNYQKLTQYNNATLIKGPDFSTDLQAMVCYYGYKTMMGHEYLLELRDAGPRVGMK
jgi:hypothetical protein